MLELIIGIVCMIAVGAIVYETRPPESIREKHQYIHRVAVLIEILTAGIVGYLVVALRK